MGTTRRYISYICGNVKHLILNAMMKKFLFLLLLVPLIVSCDKDGDSLENILNGTTWVRHAPERGDTYELTEKFVFSENTGVYYIAEKENGKVIFDEYVNFSYKFESSNKIIISILNKTAEVIIEGRKLMFLAGYGDEQQIFIFTKQ